MISYLFARLWYLLCFGLLLANTAVSKDSFSQIAPNLLNLFECTPYAYGDFNADKLIDIFCISNSDKQIEIWLAQDTFKDSLFIKYKTLTLVDETIVNLIPGDFNGDSVIDLMVVYRNTTAVGEEPVFLLRLYIGNKTAKNENDLSKSIDYSFKFKDQPLATDLNGDGITDLIGEDQDGRKYYYFNEEGNVTPEKQNDSRNKLYKGYSNSIVDLNNDYSPDLVLTAQTGQNLLYEIWMRENGKFEYIRNYSAPANAIIIGQSVFADFDSDGNFEHLLAACKDKYCKNSTIFIYKNQEWIELPIEVNDFIFQSEPIDEFENNNIGMSIKVGDYNLDGYLDLLVVMRDGRINDKNSHFAVVLKNSPCADANKCNSMYSRTFKIDLNINQLLSINNVYLASFFDINDDGSLDILLLLKDSNNKSFNLLAFKNELYDDVYFLKVMVIPGRCDSNCLFGTLPYGMNYGSPFIKIETESFEYRTFKAYACQLSQTAHLSLQLPYIIFGLGSTPNFVDRLTVGIEVKNKENGNILPLHRDWTSIIPNSQLVISVNPRQVTQNWKMQLFLTPSKNILLTGISLASTMICLIIVIILLQYREKKIDEKERKLESQRFHFDGL